MLTLLKTITYAIKVNKLKIKNLVGIALAMKQSKETKENIFNWHERTLKILA